MLPSRDCLACSAGFVGAILLVLCGIEIEVCFEVWIGKIEQYERSTIL